MPVVGYATDLDGLRLEACPRLRLMLWLRLRDVACPWLLLDVARPWLVVGWPWLLVEAWPVCWSAIMCSTSSGRRS